VASVTVCIPTRNRAALVASAIGSVLAQTFQDFELLVSDNASEDDTEAVVRSFGDPRLRYLRHASNLGAAGNFNACLRTVQTEYALVLCDDDTLQPEFLQTAVPALRSDAGVGFVYTTWQRRRDDGTVDDEVINFSRLAEVTRLSGGEFVDLAIRTQSNVAHVSSVLMRTAAVPADRFDPRDGFAMDVGLLLKIAARWDVVFLPSPLMAVRQGPDSLSGRIMGVAANGRVAWDLDADVKRREVKLRFLAGPGRDLPDVARLRREVKRSFRRRVMWHAAVALRRGGQLGAARRAFAQGVAVDAGVVWDPYGWRTAVAALAGPTLANRLRGLHT